MKNYNTLTIAQAEELLLKHQPIPGNLYENAERKVLLYPHDGDGGTIPTTTPLCIPHLITLMVSPMGCGIHLTETGRGCMHNEGRAWLLRLTEKDIVLGMQEQRITQAVNEILENTTDRVDGILLCATCMDALLSTDLSAIARHIERRFHTRTEAEFMGPFLNDSPKQAEFRMMSAVYRLLRSPNDPAKIPAVNIIGTLEKPACLPELYHFLRPLGIEDIFCISDFDSIEDADIMTQSKANIILNAGAQNAARYMEKSWKIPGVFMSPSCDVEMISANYDRLSQILGTPINDSCLRSEVSNQIKLIAPYLKNYRCGVGGKNNVPCFSAACSLIKLGCDVRIIFAHNITQNDLEEITWLKNKKPNIKIYFDSHPSMYGYRASADEFNLSFGVPDPFLCRSEGILDAPLLDFCSTYSDILDFIENLKNTISRPVKKSGKTISKYKKCWHYNTTNEGENGNEGIVP